MPHLSMSVKYILHFAFRLFYEKKKMPDSSNPLNCCMYKCEMAISVISVKFHRYANPDINIVGYGCYKAWPKMQNVKCETFLVDILKVAWS